MRLHIDIVMCISIAFITDFPCQTHQEQASSTGDKFELYTTSRCSAIFCFPPNYVSKMLLLTLCNAKSTHLTLAYYEPQAVDIQPIHPELIFMLSRLIAA